MKLPFYKYHGAGNDFILIDNRKNDVYLQESGIAHLCNRHFGIGADGLMFLENISDADFYMRYFNADGCESTMCGNGGRCIVAFAAQLGIMRDEYRFNAIDGEHFARLLSKSKQETMVCLQMSNVKEIQQHGTDYFLNTGSPHVVRFVSDADAIDVVAEGRAIRCSEAYAPHGVNVNFVQPVGDALYVRTYERGVENETLACGTGAVASAVAASLLDNAKNNTALSWDIKTRGGILNVAFSRSDNYFSDIYLTGSAILVFEGEIEIPCEMRE